MGTLDNMSMEEKRDLYMNYKKQDADGTLSDALRPDFDKLRSMFEA